MIVVYLIFLVLSVMLFLYGIMTFVSLAAAYVKYGDERVGFLLGLVLLLISAVALIGGSYGIWRYVSLVFV